MNVTQSYEEQRKTYWDGLMKLRSEVSSSWEDLIRNESTIIVFNSPVGPVKLEYRGNHAILGICSSYFMVMDGVYAGENLYQTYS